jgi:hypothetical protein
VKQARKLPGDNEFVAYIDALGELDGKQCLIDWKTTASRYSEEPDGLLSLDPQLICYSWISGISMSRSWCSCGKIIPKFNI